MVAASVPPALCSFPSANLNHETATRGTALACGGEHAETLKGFLTYVSCSILTVVGQAGWYVQMQYGPKVHADFKKLLEDLRNNRKFEADLWCFVSKHFVKSSGLMLDIHVKLFFCS